VEFGWLSRSACSFLFAAFHQIVGKLLVWRSGEIVESTDDRCVGTTTECPWHKRWKELGLEIDTCGEGHQRWGDGAIESLNPDFTFKLTKNMLRGDPHCEWVVERKK
jgi:hypothetical protein